MNKYVDVVKDWMKDPKSVSASQLTANYRAAREAYPIHKPRTPSEWAGLDACFESCLSTTTRAYLAGVSACLVKYDLEVANGH